MPPVGELPLQHNRRRRESRQLQLQKERTPCQRYRWHLCFFDRCFKRPTIILYLRSCVRLQIESSTLPINYLHISLHYCQMLSKLILSPKLDADSSVSNLVICSLWCSFKITRFLTSFSVMFEISATSV